MAAHVAGGVWLGDEWGFDERSCKPSTLWARKQATHLPRRRPEKARDRRHAEPGVHNRTHHRFSTFGGQQRILVAVHSVPESLKLRQPQPFPSDRMDNLLKVHS